MKPRAKIWLEKNSKPFFGDGRCELLKAIVSEGSLNQGAKKLHMSYKQAWDEINLMEKRMGFKLLNRKIGGAKGGGAKLTKDAIILIKKYEKFRDKVKDAIKKEFDKSFK